MAKYDNTGDVKRKRFPFFLTIFIIGIVLFIVGVVLIKVTNTKSLGKRYSYNETFDVAAIDNMEIDFSAGDLNIKMSSDENIHVTGEKLPEKILFYNGGVTWTTEGSDSLEDLKTMEEQGVEILSCGTCLNFYGLTDKLKVGSVTNMYDIVESMAKADKVIHP